MFININTAAKLPTTLLRVSWEQSFTVVTNSFRDILCKPKSNKLDYFFYLNPLNILIKCTSIIHTKYYFNLIVTVTYKSKQPCTTARNPYVLRVGCNVWSFKRKTLTASDLISINLKWPIYSCCQKFHPINIGMNVMLLFRGGMIIQHLINLLKRTGWTNLILFWIFSNSHSVFW